MSQAPIILSRHTLEALHYVTTKARIFRQPLSDIEREEAYEKYKYHISEAISAKAAGKEELKFIEEEIPSFDGPSTLSREAELEARKNLSAATVKMAEARAQVELVANSLGFRWIEVDTQTYADDIAREMITVRVDTMQQVNKRRMSGPEEEAAEARQQGELPFARH